MTSINSAEAIKKSNAISLKSNTDKTQQAAAMASSFAQQLATASSKLNDSGIASAANSVINSAQSGLNLPSGNGLNSRDILSQSLKTGVKSQFTDLSNEIASSLIASLSGQNKTNAAEKETATDATTKTEAASSVDAIQKSTDTPASAETANKAKDSTSDKVVTATSDDKIADTGAADDTQKSESSSSFFPEFIQNLFADLSIFNTQNATALTKNDSEKESTVEQVNTPDEASNLTSEEKVAS